MSWAERSAAIKVGDRVAYSRRFLRSISCFTGDMPQARGKVNVKNLSCVTERGIMDVD